jgi:hypothetical protein
MNDTLSLRSDVEILMMNNEMRSKCSLPVSSDKSEENYGLEATKLVLCVFHEIVNFKGDRINISTNSNINNNT